jgi:hypothetical protein
MFRRKYTVTLLDSKWNPIKNRLKMSIIPRKDEFIYFNEQYYTVLNIVHNIARKQGICVVVEELNQMDKK